MKNSNNGIVGNISNSSSSSSNNNHNINNNISSNNNNNNNNERIIADATKLLLKNGLNGSTAAAAAAALVGATSIHLPPLPPPPTHHTGVFYPTTSNAAAKTTTAIQGCAINNGQPSASLLSSTTKAATSTIPATTPFSKQQRAATMAAATATTTNTDLLSTASSSPPLTTPSSTVSSSGGNEYKVDNGVIDYTVSAPTTAATNLVKNQNKFTNSNIGSGNSDIGRHPISATAAPCFGGRLQFFKDGKFILELARSKDGEKGGWVSVPRKIFRTPSSATSSTITPTATTSTAYPKNESSTSLSFSDDNSSIQSSPWQRDHCWKQTAPRSGISKEMSLFYQRSNHLTLSIVGLQSSRKKRRRPFDNTNTPSWEKAFAVVADAQLDKNKIPLATISKLNKNCANSKYNLSAEADTKISKIECSSEDDICSNSSSTATLTGGDCIDGGGVVMSKTPTPTAAIESPISSPKPDVVDHKAHIKSENVKDEIKVEQTSVETMNTSEDDHDVDEEMLMVTVKKESTKEQVNGEAVKEKTTDATQSSIEEKIMASESESKVDGDSGAGEKRLKKLKARAKLITIIQKLIDRLPTTGHHLHLSKIPQSGIGGAHSNHSSSLAHKISPPSSSSASSSATRLVELQYHQQHVSPRKRILREFEKVSLEDTAAAAGGKRSRAKTSTTSTSTSNAAKSSPQRVQSTVCAALTTSTTTTPTTTNGSFCKSGTAGSTKSVQPPPPPPSSSSTPTRLYSSYSIHSLLGGGNPTSSTTSLSTTSTVTGTSKKINEQAIISNSSYHQQHQQHYTDPSYLRAMLASPKSPESSCSIGGIGGKSPSNLSSKKRSPPYSSPLHDNHSRSPTVASHIAATGDYGRRSPRQTTISLPPSSSQFQSSQQQYHQHQQQQQVFYSPYMMSPKYVPAPQTSMSPTHNVASRSPRHSSAFSAHIPHTNAAASANSIPPRELSSPTRSAPASPREPNANNNSNTPRTVPKKTASIRRQFASPTSCPSPSERVDEQERKTPLTAINHSSGGTAPLHNYHQRASPNSIVAPASASPLHYYNMYPPNSSAGSSSPITGVTSSSGSSAAQAAVAAAAAAAAYIPTVVPTSYYHPYISTFAALRNPMWMQHYPAATSMMTQHPSSPQGTAVPPSSRFSQPFHNFPYNGVNAAAVAAAFSGQIAPSHLAQMGLIGHQMMPAPSAIHHAGGGGVFGSGGGQTHSPKLTDDNINTLATTSKQTATNMFPSSMKEEHNSSDVPLNLSKH